MEESRRDLEIAAARSVVLQVYGELVLRQGPAPSLRIEGDPDLVNRSRAEAAGDTLTLTLGRDWLERLTSGLAMLGNRPLRYLLTLPDVEKLVVNGRGRLRVEGLRAPRFELRVAGLGDGHLRDLDVGTLDSEINGRGELAMHGAAREHAVRVSGSAQLSAFRLASDRVTVRISGHGEIDVAVRESLDVNISGYGHVNYRGDPRVHEAISGGGGVHRREGAQGAEDATGAADTADTADTAGTRDATDATDAADATDPQNS